MVTIDGYTIDAALNEQHTYDSDITPYPVEEGSDVTDNVHNQPPVVVVHGLVSDTPIGTMVNVRAQQGPSDNTGEFDFLPSDEALSKLLAIRDAKEPITIGTTLKRYDSMLLKTLEIPVDPDTGYALEFTATFVYLRVITNNRTTIRVAAPNNTTKKKFSGPPVVYKHNGPKHITTQNGYDATWNPSKGRYEYGKTGDGHGDPVPDSDLNEGEQSNPPTGNDTYYDTQADEWRNTDGTAVTQSQIDAKQTVPTSGQVASGVQPWWK